MVGVVNGDVCESAVRLFVRNEPEDGPTAATDRDFVHVEIPLLVKGHGSVAGRTSKTSDCYIAIG